MRESEVKRIVKLLNEALKLDSDCIENLCLNRVLCNKDIADHPTIQVIENQKTKKFNVGLIGLLNGFVGPKYVIQMAFDEGNTANISYFTYCKVKDVVWKTQK